MSPRGHCSWKRSQQNAQETLGPCTAPAELSSSDTVPGETESRCRSDLVASAGLEVASAGNSGSSGNLPRGQEELGASPTLTHPHGSPPGKGSIFSSRIPAGRTAGPAGAAAAPQRGELKFPQLPRGADSYAPHRLRAGTLEATRGWGHTHTHTKKAPSYRRQRVTLSRVVAGSE